MALDYWRNKPIFTNATYINAAGFYDLDPLVHKNIIYCNSGGVGDIILRVNSNPIIADLYYKTIFVVNTNLSNPSARVYIAYVGESQTFLPISTLEACLVVWDNATGVYRVMFDSGIEINNSLTSAELFNLNIFPMPTGTGTMALEKVSGMDQTSGDLACKIETPNILSIYNYSESKPLYVFISSSLDVRDTGALTTTLTGNITGIPAGNIFYNVQGRYTSGNNLTNTSPWMIFRLDSTQTSSSYCFVSYTYNNPNATANNLLISSKFEISFWR